MPTTKQLHDMWEAEMAFPSIRRTDDPMYVPPKEVREFTGKHIGVIAYDEETGDLKIIVDQPNAPDEKPLNP